MNILYIQAIAGFGLVAFFGPWGWKAYQDYLAECEEAAVEEEGDDDDIEEPADVIASYHSDKAGALFEFLVGVIFFGIGLVLLITSRNQAIELWWLWCCVAGIGLSYATSEVTESGFQALDHVPGWVVSGSLVAFAFGVITGLMAFGQYLLGYMS